MTEKWTGHRVVIRILNSAENYSDRPGYIEGTAVEETSDLVKVKGLLLARWHRKSACRLVEDADHD